MANQYKAYALIKAIAKKDYTEVKKLINLGIDINKKDSLGRTALMYACSYDITKLKLLTADGLDISDSAYNALIKDIENKDIELVQLFIDNGIDVNIKDNNGGSALMTAVIYGRKQIVKLLIESGAEINSAVSKFGLNALMYAINNIDVDPSIIELLIKNGADIYSKNSSGDSALTYVLRKGYLELAKLMISSGVDIKAANNFATTALLFTSDKIYT